MTARIGSAKTGGRRKGSLDKGARAIVTSEMANDLLLVYQKLGGVRWLLKFAEDNPAEFLRQGLSRLFPAPQKDDADVVQNNFNISNLTERDAAVRVAFALSKAIYESEPIDVSPAYPAPRWQSPDDLPPLLPPEPVEDPDKQRWIEELPLTSEQRRDNAVIRETHEASITNYHGSVAEQGGLGPAKRQSVGKPTVSEMHRRMRNRRDELL